MAQTSTHETGLPQSGHIIGHQSAHGGGVSEDRGGWAENSFGRTAGAAAVCNSITECASPVNSRQRRSTEGRHITNSFVGRSFGALSMASMTDNDSVLLRCRDTIERLHKDLQEERQQRHATQKQMQMVVQRLGSLEQDRDSVTSALQTVTAELESERARRLEAEEDLRRSKELCEAADQRAARMQKEARTKDRGEDSLSPLSRRQQLLGRTVRKDDEERNFEDDVGVKALRRRQETLDKERRILELEAALRQSELSNAAAREDAHGRLASSLREADVLRSNALASAGQTSCRQDIHVGRAQPETELRQQDADAGAEKRQAEMSEQERSSGLVDAAFVASQWQAWQKRHPWMTQNQRGSDLIRWPQHDRGDGEVEVDAVKRRYEQKIAKLHKKMTKKKRGQDDRVGGQRDAESAVDVIRSCATAHTPAGVLGLGLGLGLGLKAGQTKQEAVALRRCGLELVEGLAVGCTQAFCRPGGVSSRRVQSLDMISKTPRKSLGEQLVWH